MAVGSLLLRELHNREDAPASVEVGLGPTAGPESQPPGRKEPPCLEPGRLRVGLPRLRDAVRESVGPECRAAVSLERGQHWVRTGQGGGCRVRLQTEGAAGRPLPGVLRGALPTPDLRLRASWPREKTFLLF